MRLDGYMMVPRGTYECVGGPLCGSLIEADTGKGKYRWRDKETNQWHYYRLVMLASQHRRKTCVFFHYFGTGKKRAERSEPCLVPGIRLWN